MADVNAQSVEDYADRIVYRYPGGRYEQTLGTYLLALTPGLKTLINTDTARTYVIPQSGLPARFFKISLEIYTSLLLTDIAGVSTTLIKTGFFKISIPSLNFDGKSLDTEFYKEVNDMIFTSPNLRAINIGDITLEPVQIPGYAQNTALSRMQFDTGAATTGLRAIIRPIVTFFKKP